MNDTITGVRIPKKLKNLMLDEKSFHKNILGIRISNKQAFNLIVEKSKLTDRRLQKVMRDIGRKLV